MFDDDVDRETANTKPHKSEESGLLFRKALGEQLQAAFERVGSRATLADLADLQKVLDLLKALRKTQRNKRSFWGRHLVRKLGLPSDSLAPAVLSSSDRESEPAGLSAGRDAESSGSPV